MITSPWSPDNPGTPVQTDFPSLSINFGPITPDNPPAKYNDTAVGDDLAIFTDYFIKNRYEKDKQIYMMPITSPTGFQGNKVAFTQLASPTLLWVADWTAARFNIQPEYPNSTPADNNWILLDEHYEPVMITVGPDGTTPLYRISGTFVYGHKNPDNNTTKNLCYSRPPWLEDVFTRTIDPSKKQQGLINITKGITGFPTR